MGQTVIKHAPIQAGVICSHYLTLGAPNARLAQLIMMERMRMCRRDFRRGMAYGYLPRRSHGRTVLPLVSR